MQAGLNYFPAPLQATLHPYVEMLSHCPSLPTSTNPIQGSEPTALLEKSKRISQVLAASPISDALITGIPADEEPLCGSAVVYVVIIFIC